MIEWLLVWVVVSGSASDPATNLPADQRFRNLQSCQRAEEMIEEELAGSGYEVKAACIEVSSGAGAASDD
jgi:hypothetical protein